jgi:hypothetical protein
MHDGRHPVSRERHPGVSQLWVAQATLLAVAAFLSCDGDSAPGDVGGDARDAFGASWHDPAPDPRDVRLEQDACTHFAEDQVVSLTASATPRPGMARIEQTHTTYEITLAPQADGEWSGFVALSVSEADIYYLFLDAALEFALYNPEDGGNLDLATGVGSTVCGLGTWAISDLSATEYHVQFAAGELSTVKALWMRAGEIPHE